jgi:ABC-2 type transport system ATP-binding protein
MIEVEELSKSYGSFVATRDVSFTVKKGEVVGFLGPNGAGKSTTMRMLTCYLSPTRGTARVAGFDIVQDPHQVKLRLGYLPENTPLYSDLTTRDYLRFVCQVRRIPAARRKGAIDEVVRVCGLEKVFARPIGKLSKGYRQRIGIAQALVHDPDFLVLDEPTSGLDPNQIVEIRELIRRVGRQKTVILSTCDRVVIINEGRIVADGTPEDLGRQIAGGDAYSIRVLESPGDVEETLRGLAGVSRVEVSSSHDPGVTVLRILSAENDRLGLEIHRLAAARGWNLLELRHETPTLEDVFIRLTLGGGTA